MPEISIIIPLYNKGRYISRALDSVFAQTYHDYEIIVVDDGSTDNGVEIVRHYSDSRLRLILQSNAGPGAARNRGIGESRARFLAFLDADDEWMPEFLQKSLGILQSNPDCDLTASAYLLGEGRIEIGMMFKKRGMTDGPWQIRRGMSVEEVKSAFYIFNSWSILCKRAVVEKYGGFRSKNHCDYGEDTFLWLQVFFNHKFFRILEPLVWYHSEASELGPGRGSEPLQTFLTDPDPIRATCPEEYRRLLEQFLADFALATAHECASDGNNIDKLRYLLKAFPLMKKSRWEYAKLRLKMSIPELIPIIRYIKSCSNEGL
jgi:glycosyltransferase involved in cell wall biosynthesis